MKLIIDIEVEDNGKHTATVNVESSIDVFDMSKFKGVGVDAVQSLLFLIEEIAEHDYKLSMFKDYGDYT